MEYPKRNYIYDAVAVSAYDADTVRFDIDKGFGDWRHNEPMRLYGIDAPEMRGLEKVQGKIARDALRNLIIGKKVVVETFKDKKGKYGRYLVIIYLPMDDRSTLNVNDWLVSNGYAVQATY